MFKYILIFIIAGFVIIQFFPIDRSTIPPVISEDFLMATSAPAEIKGIVKISCYDCHSYETVYPWYAQVAPVSWWLDDHIEHGRNDLNFSVWQTYTLKKKKHKIEEMIEMIEKDEMPLTSYTAIHWDANLIDDQKDKLIDWLKNVDTNL